MFSLSKVFSKYTGALRSVKIFYVLNNLLNARRLRHNKRLYEKAGLKKSIFSNISSVDFQTPVGDIPWLDKPGALENIQNHQEFREFDLQTQKALLSWHEQGYLILPKFYSSAEADELNMEIDQLMQAGKAGFGFSKRIMDAFELSSLVDQNFFRNDRMLKILRFILGEKIHPFQTINFIEGSQQRAHSDFIHMTSEPKGFLIATWTALEDCDEGNGPLFYYPGSHKLPFILSNDFESGHSRWLLGKNSYKKYEDRIAAVLEENQFEKKNFHAKKGDVLIWHANLLHGGNPITEPGRTRKSMVCHYFCENVICYHEISHRPALFKK